MATFKKGILGGFNGKVGNIVGYSRYGKSVMRSLAEHVKNPQTEAQQATRARFKELVTIGVAFQPAAEFGLDKVAEENGNTVLNSFFSKNWNNVRFDEEEHLVVDYGKLMLSSGPLTAPSFKTPKTDVDLTVTVEYGTDADVPRTDGQDDVYVFVYQPELKQGLLGHGTRQLGSVSVKVPALWSGTDVHVYGFAVGDGRYNADLHSNTVYLGTSTIE